MNAYMGIVIAFKALVAALLGGLGSIAGAALGGITIGVVETAWTAWLGGDYRDLAIFAILALVVIFQPAGLLGKSRST